MRKTLTSAAIALALGAGAAQAAPITLPPGSPIYFQFNNLEQVSATNSIAVPGGSIDVTGDGIPDTPATEGNWGVFNISTLQTGAIATPNTDISGGPAFFFDDGATGGLEPFTQQGQISGIFYGISLTSATTATGGFLDVYWEDAADDDIDAADLNGGFSPANRTAANQAGKFTDGTLLLRLQFKPGIQNGDAVTTLKSSIDPVTAGPLGTPGGQGLAEFFADVVDINNDGVIDSADGAWAFALDSNWFHVDVNGNGVFGEDGEQRDLRFSTFFNLLNQWSGLAPDGSPIVGLRSNDPGRAFSVAEPGMVSLLGLGLLGAGLNLRRRKSA